MTWLPHDGTSTDDELDPDVPPCPLLDLGGTFMRCWGTGTFRARAKTLETLAPSEEKDELTACDIMCAGLMPAIDAPAVDGRSFGVIGAGDAVVGAAVI